MVHSEHFSAFLRFYFPISKKNYDVVFALHNSHLCTTLQAWQRCQHYCHAARTDGSQVREDGSQGCATA